MHRIPLLSHRYLLLPLPDSAHSQNYLQSFHKLSYLSLHIDPLLYFPAFLQTHFQSPGYSSPVLDLHKDHFLILRSLPQLLLPTLFCSSAFHCPASSSLLFPVLFLYMHSESFALQPLESPNLFSDLFSSSHQMTSSKPPFLLTVPICLLKFHFTHIEIPDVPSDKVSYMLLAPPRKSCLHCVFIHL